MNRENTLEIPGPLGDLDGSAGFMAVDGPPAVTMPLEEPIHERGRLAFWFRTDRSYLSQAGGAPFQQDLVEAPGLFRISFESADNQISLLWRWHFEKARADADLSLQLPGIPGPAWIHLAAHWDAGDGLFQVFLNGTPLRQRGTRLSPWVPRQEPPDHLKIHLNRFAFSQIQAGAGPLPERFPDPGLTALHHGSLDSLLGARDRGRLDLDEFKGTLLYRNDLDRAESVGDWVMEGPGVISFEQGWMRMRSERPDGPQGHHVFWCDRDFPDSYAATWEIQLLKEEGLCIVFLAATGRDGLDLFHPSLPPREGIFPRYTRGEIQTYHISYYANNPVLEPGRATSNMRKNPGAFLVDNGPIGIPVGTTAVHRVVLVKEGPRVRLGVDGRKVIDFYDDGRRFGAPLREGKIGLRQMQWTEARYRHFRVYGIGPDSPQP